MGVLDNIKTIQPILQPKAPRSPDTAREQFTPSEQYKAEQRTQQMIRDTTPMTGGGGAKVSPITNSVQKTITSSTRDRYNIVGSGGSSSYVKGQVPNQQTQKVEVSQEAAQPKAVSIGAITRAQRNLPEGFALSGGAIGGTPVPPKGWQRGQTDPLDLATKSSRIYEAATVKTTATSKLPFGTTVKGGELSRTVGAQPRAKTESAFVGSLEEYNQELANQMRDIASASRDTQFTWGEETLTQQQALDKLAEEQKKTAEAISEPIRQQNILAGQTSYERAKLVVKGMIDFPVNVAKGLTIFATDKVIREKVLASAKETFVPSVKEFLKSPISLTYTGLKESVSTPEALGGTLSFALLTGAVVRGSAKIKGIDVPTISEQIKMSEIHGRTPAKVGDVLVADTKIIQKAGDVSVEMDVGARATIMKSPKELKDFAKSYGLKASKAKEDSIAKINLIEKVGKGKAKVTSSEELLTSESQTVSKGDISFGVEYGATLKQGWLKPDKIKAKLQREYGTKEVPDANLFGSRTIGTSELKIKLTRIRDMGLKDVSIGVNKSIKRGEETFTIGERLSKSTGKYLRYSKKEMYDVAGTSKTVDLTSGKFSEGLSIGKTKVYLARRAKPRKISDYVNPADMVKQKQTQSGRMSSVLGAHQKNIESALNIGRKKIADVYKQRAMRSATIKDMQLGAGSGSIKMFKEEKQMQVTTPERMISIEPRMKTESAMAQIRVREQKPKTEGMLKGLSGIRDMGLKDVSIGVNKSIKRGEETFTIGERLSKSTGKYLRYSKKEMYDVAGTSKTVDLTSGKFSEGLSIGKTKVYLARRAKPRKISDYVNPADMVKQKQTQSGRMSSVLGAHQKNIESALNLERENLEELRAMRSATIKDMQLGAGSGSIKMFKEEKQMQVTTPERMISIEPRMKTESAMAQIRVREQKPKTEGMLKGLSGIRETMPKRDVTPTITPSLKVTPIQIQRQQMRMKITELQKTKTPTTTTTSKITLREPPTRPPIFGRGKPSPFSTSSLLSRKLKAFRVSFFRKGRGWEISRQRPFSKKSEAERFGALASLKTRSITGFSVKETEAGANVLRKNLPQFAGKVRQRFMEAGTDTYFETPRQKKGSSKGADPFGVGDMQGRRLFR